MVVFVLGMAFISKIVLFVGGSQAVIINRCISACCHFQLELLLSTVFNLNSLSTHLQN